MPIGLSIKNRPDEVAEQLQWRPARHHRSSQGELLAIFEAPAGAPPHPDTGGPT